MNYTWITLADSEEYLKSVYALAFSLKQSNTKYPLQVMIPEDSVSMEAINIFKEKCQQLNYFINIIYIPNLMFNILTPFPNIFNTTLNKFFIFTLEEFDKIIFLDADMIITSNCDNIFDYNFPVIAKRDDNKISGNILGIQSNKKFWYFILNICFTYNFQNDEEVIAFLHHEGFFPLNTFIQNDTRVFHDGGYPKYWFKFSWQELVNYLQLNYHNIYYIMSHNDCKYCYACSQTYSKEKEKQYIQDIKASLKKQYN